MAGAAQAGMSLSDYATAELKKAVERPTRQQVLERLAALPPIETQESAAD